MRPSASVNPPQNKMLLLSCCAPCSCGVIKKLANEKRNFTVLFYNPNIQEETEYFRRLNENKSVCDKYNVPFVELDWEPDVWKKAIGDTPFKERGARCSLCFQLRLEKAARWAKENGFDTFSSVLGFSRNKDLAQVNAAAQKASFDTGIPYDTTNWRTNNLYNLTQELAKELHLYRQEYCGCMPLKNKSCQKFEKVV